MLRPLLALLVAGWLADALASRDRDVAAGIAAHERGEYTEALARYDAAQERLGERPEIHFNRGLSLLASGDAEGARSAFERGSEADRDDVRSSSFYELGNVAFDAGDWDAAIAAYIECLKVRPDHGSAKWNLELALRKKAEEEKEQEKEQEQENQDGDGEEGEEGEKGEDPQDKPQEEPDEPDPQDEPQDEPDQGEEPQPPGEEPGEEKPPEPPPGEQPADSPADDEPRPAAPEPIERADLDRALEGLDAEDNFMLTRPGGRARKVERDW